MESIASYKVSHPLLIDKISSIVFWRRSAKYNQSIIFLPNNICGFGLTLSGDLLVKRELDFQKMPAFGTRNTLKKPSAIKTSGEFFNISVRLKIPNGLSLFTKIPMNIIYDEDAVSLNDIFSSQEINDLVGSLLETPNDEEKIKVLELFLVSKLIDCHPPLFLALIAKIHEAKGQSNVRQLASYFSVSERTIHRLFKKLIGVNPNNYINLIRFRTVLKFSSEANTNFLGNALDVGYYDQAHFIKHFKAFSTFTPAQFSNLNYFNKVSDFYNL
ncbi:MAG: helix-turn-helix domain-containing protein [Sphingobacteriaceae bacterium]|jgi:AraC-like DNA-binding protein